MGSGHGGRNQTRAEETLQAAEESASMGSGHGGRNQAAAFDVFRG